MKTPIQEMIEVIKGKLKVDTLQYNARPSNGSLIAIKISQFYLEMAESLLEKEKEVMKKMFIEGDWTDYYLGIEDESFEYLYNETFKDIPLK